MTAVNDHYAAIAARMAEGIEYTQHSNDDAAVRASRALRVLTQYSQIYEAPTPTPPWDMHAMLSAFLADVMHLSDVVEYYHPANAIDLESALKCGQQAHGEELHDYDWEWPRTCQPCKRQLTDDSPDWHAPCDTCGTPTTDH